MDKNLKKYSKNDTEDRLYDPELASILIFVIGALGALGGIASTLDYIERKQYKKREYNLTEKRISEIKLEISYSFRNISLSIDSIRRRLEFLGKICQVAYENNEKFTDHNIRFGNCPVFLNPFQFKAYKNEQDVILREIIEMNNNIFYIEELLGGIPDSVNNADYIVNKRLQLNLKEIIYEINNLMQEFGKITTNEFFDRTIRLCKNIEEINSLREDMKNLL